MHSRPLVALLDGRDCSVEMPILKVPIIKMLILKMLILKMLMNIAHSRTQDAQTQGGDVRWRIKD